MSDSVTGLNSSLYRSVLLFLCLFSCSDQEFTTNVDVSLRVISVSPSAFAEGAPIDSLIVVRFNQNLKAASITPKHAYIEDITNLQEPKLLATVLDYQAENTETQEAATLTLTPVDAQGQHVVLAY